MNTEENNISKVPSRIKTSNNLTLKNFYLLCLDNWKWFALSLVVAALLAAAFIVVTQPVFTRKAEILIKDDENNGGGMGAFGNMAELGGLFGSTLNVYNELGAIQSDYLLYNVVKRMHLNVSYTVKGLRDKDLYGKDLPITVNFDDLSDEDAAGMVVNLKKDGMFTMKKFYKVIEENGNKKEKDDSELSGKVNTTVQTPVGKVTVKATPYLNNLKDDVTIHIEKQDPIVTQERLSKNFSAVVTSRDAAIIKMNYKDVSKQRAVDVLNEILEVYKEDWINDKNQVAMSSSKFIEDRLRLLEKELGDVDNDISRYKSQNLTPDVMASAHMYMSNANAANVQLTELRNQLNMIQYFKEYLNDKTQATQPLPTGLTPFDKSLTEIFNNYNTLVLQRNRVAAGSSSNHPLVADYDQQLEALRKAVLASLDNGAKQMQIEIRGIEAKENQNNAKIAESPAKATHLLSSERQQKVKQELYLFLLQKREENQLSQAFTAYNLRILTPPMGRKKASFPVKRNVALLALLLGLAIPAAALFIRERSITTIRGRKDIEALSIPFVGEIPQFKGKRKQDTKNRILVQPKKRNIINEAFRVMRTNLEFMSNSYHARAFLVTSINPGSGKTFSTINMAASFALKGSKVAVVDLDLRKASLSIYVNSPRKGVSTYLSEQTDDWKSLLVKHPDNSTLDILPCGTIPPNPAELLANGRINRLLEELKQDYDYIFMDCAPVEIVADTNIIADLADMSIFIVRSGLLEKDMLPVIEDIYAEKKLKNMALILNGTDATVGRYHRTGYGYGYGGYATED